MNSEQQIINNFPDMLIAKKHYIAGKYEPYTTDIVIQLSSGDVLKYTKINYRWKYT